MAMSSLLLRNRNLLLIHLAIWVAIPAFASMFVSNPLFDPLYLSAILVFKACFLYLLIGRTVAAIEMHRHADSIMS